MQSNEKKINKTNKKQKQAKINLINKKLKIYYMGNIYYICKKTMSIYIKILIPVDGIRIKKARQKAGLTQTNLALLTGLTQEYISYLENGKVKNIHKAMYNRIAKIIKL